MNMLNIPKSYIPTSEEMIALTDELDWAILKSRIQLHDPSHPHIGILESVQRKLNLLDRVFRAAEDPSLEEEDKSQTGHHWLLNK